MKKSTLFSLVSIVVVLSMALASCAPAATTATTAPTTGAAAAPTATTAAAPAQPTATTAATAAATKAATAAATTAATAAATTAASTGGFTGLKDAAADCTYGGEFKSIEAVDKYTVKFTLCYSDPALPSKAAFDVFAIAPKALLDSTGGDSVKMSDAANGTGPFMKPTWTRGDNVTYTANPNWWNGAVTPKSFILKWSEQPAQRLLELQSTQADGIDNVAPEDFASITANKDLALLHRDPLNIFYIGFNNTIAPFDNENVRQAFAMAINRDRIVKQFYPDGSIVSENFAPPALKPGFSPDIKWYTFDQAKAKQMLTDAKFDFTKTYNLSFRNVVRTYLPSPDKVATEIQAELKTIGVNIKINQEESTTFLDNTSAGKEGFYMLGWGADYPDSTDFYDYHFANTANKQFGTLFPDLVDAIKKAGQTADPAARQKFYDTVNTLVKQHVPMIPVANGTSAAAFTAATKNAKTSALGNEPFYGMDNGKDTLTFVQGAEPAALWCGDETDGESLRACQQIYEPLLNYKAGGVEVVPWLAKSFDVNADATEYTFHLNQGVKFHDGTELNANDVVASYTAQWDAKDPNHKGRTGTFDYFGAFFGAFLNAPKK
ncbi:MAG TPA: ABC transporter substrate-binding protein [Anaerolineaceae bacterium]